MEKYYTSQETASRLRVHLRTLYEWMRLGIIQGRRIGRSRKWLFTEADIRRAIQELTPEEAEVAAATNGEGE